MRASRLLRILLALQNRGRLTTLQLATELEVARRTVMRDIDALTEAGLPIVVHRGNTGGVELGFNYRSRFFGLDAREAEALGVLLAFPHPAVAELDLSAPAQSVRDKLVESMPERVRKRIQKSQKRFQLAPGPTPRIDIRVAALAEAIRNAAITRIQAKSRTPRIIHPVALQFGPHGWAIVDAKSPDVPIPLGQAGDINISAQSFLPPRVAGSDS
jgi:predicted DNA-binding transcriptional regulator YafY